MSPLLTPGLAYADALLPLGLGLLALTLAWRVARVPPAWRGWLLALASGAVLAAVPALGWLGLAGLGGGSLAVAAVACWLDRRAPGRWRRPALGALIALLAAVTIASWICLPPPPGTASGWRVASAFCLLRWIHLLVDGARRQLGGAGPLTVAGYLLFFPTFFYGPLGRCQRFAEDLGRTALPPLEPARLAHEAVLGLFKVLGLPALVGHLSLAAWRPEELVDQPSPLIVVGRVVITFALLYGQWSGVTDLARVAGRLLGLELPRDFTSPASWTGPAAFWQKGWHTSVVGWFSRYVGDPLTVRLGGERRWLARAAGAAIALIGYALWLGVGPRPAVDPVWLGLWALGHVAMLSVALGIGQAAHPSGAPGRAAAVALTVALVSALAVLLAPAARGGLAALALPIEAHEASLAPADWRALRSVKLSAVEGGLGIETLTDDPHLELHRPWSPRCGRHQVLSLVLEARPDETRCADDILQVFFRTAGTGARYSEARSVIVPLRCGRAAYHLRVPDGLCPAHVRLDPDWGRRPARYTLRRLTLRSTR